MAWLISVQRRYARQYRLDSHLASLRRHVSVEMQYRVLQSSPSSASTTSTGGASSSECSGSDKASALAIAGLRSTLSLPSQPLLSLGNFLSPDSWPSSPCERGSDCVESDMMFAIDYSFDFLGRYIMEASSICSVGSITHRWSDEWLRSILYVEHSPSVCVPRHPLSRWYDVVCWWGVSS